MTSRTRLRATTDDRGIVFDANHRCGKRSYHIQKSTCASCGYPSARTRKCTSCDFAPETLAARSRSRGFAHRRVRRLEWTAQEGFE
jgi:ribosomal protein L37E